MFEIFSNFIETNQLIYPILIFCLFVFPRFLVRIGIPVGISAFLMGVGSSVAFGYTGDKTVELLGTLGIVSLFLFAGLEVDFKAIKSNRKVLLQHLVISVCVLALLSLLVVFIFNLSIRPALLVALTLVTPSTGFIINSLNHSSFSDEKKFWIKTKSIVSELLALVILFFVIQSGDWKTLSSSLLVLIFMIFLLPIVFKFFAKKIAPYAPQSEFGFLLMVAILCGIITMKLGTYYLVGAFMVGVAAQRFEEDLPDMVSEEMFHAIRVFTSFFIPFYFFKSGLLVNRSDFTWTAFSIGIGLLVAVAPFRLLGIVIHRRYSLNESAKQSLTVATALFPTLIFGLVLIGILKNKFHLNEGLFAGLIVYTIVATLIPSFILRQYKVPLKNEIFEVIK